MYMKRAGDFLPSQKIVRNDKSLFSRGGLQCEMTWHRGTKLNLNTGKIAKKITEDTY